RTLCDHRHSTRTDIGSVFCACLTLLLVNLAPFVAAAFLCLIPLAAWFFLRRDLIKMWRTQGWLFLLRALPLAFLLDLVRGLCVITVGFEYCCANNLRLRRRGLSGGDRKTTTAGMPLLDRR